ncbi:ABC transporter permease DevC [Acaryochloris sp. IP29b_bin.137]|uniref:ABC transporter permease DevC n=1 Tax=Acaryochloris sp. IP29b_bin.137 TaxID=2969217 RepID=UPI002631FEDB|nr:ABC transporter permease DevC [Acaryochloris sp. IP29b_bin.137]
MIAAIPIAWLQLIHQRVRFAVTLAGIAFVVLLLFMQLGIQDALFESSIRVHQSLQGDLFLVSSQYQALTSQQNFPRSRLYQTLASDQVESVKPLYIQFGKLKNIETGQKYAIFVFGIDPGLPPFSSPEVMQNLDQVKSANFALFDRDSRSEFGPISERVEKGEKIQVEISQFGEITEAKRFEIRGLFSLGTSFGVDGNIIVNATAFLHTFEDRLAEEINIGLITLKPETNPQQVRASLIANLPKDVQILSLADFSKLEKRYWNLRTPIGFIFKIMVVIGLVVGIGVAYQILYSNVSNHIIEYATLKAIGFKNSYLLKIIFKQALLLSTLGYIPGTLAAVGVYAIAEDATKLPVVMTASKGITVLFLVTMMCVFSGLLAMQKLRSADPVDVF